MDLRQYFRKIREIEAAITEPHTFVTSLETSDGGKAGTITEVPRHLAARMIAEGAAVLTSEAEREDFLKKQRAAREVAKRAEAARRLQVTIVSDADGQIDARAHTSVEKTPIKR
ncbi:MAG TPA: hypothetical protein VHZ55_00295 [Bryobacteraceae bacterium]|nr:hypothetical protein [Bryobacteraceae bacterium]